MEASISSPCHGSKMSDDHNRRKELLEELEQMKLRLAELQESEKTESEEQFYLDYQIEDFERKLEKLESKNSDIDLERSKDNVTYVSKTWQSVYEEEIEPHYQDHQESMAKSKRNVNKIGEHVKTQIDALKVNKKHKHFHREMIVAVGQSDDGIPDDLKAEILDEYMKSFQERNPNLRVFSATMHRDERQSHLHIDFVPIAHQEKGQKVVQSMDKAMKQQFDQQGYEEPENKSKKGYYFNAWQQNERKIIEGLMNERGIEVVRPGSHKTKSIPTYKREIEQAKKEARVEAQKIIDQKDEVINELSKKVDFLESNIVDLEFEITQNQGIIKQQNVQLTAVTEQLDAKDAILKKYPEIVDGEDYELSGKNVFGKPKKDYERMEADAKQLAPTIQRLEIANKRLDDEKNSTDHERQLKEYYRRQDEAKSAELKKLNIENQGLKKENKSLKEQLSLAWDNFKTYKDKVLRKFGFKEVEKFENEEVSVEAENLNAIDSVLQDHKDNDETIGNESYTPIKDAVLIECVYDLSPDENTYYHLDQWLETVNGKLETGSPENSVLFTGYSDFYNDHKVDIEGAIKSMKRKPVTEKDKVTEAYKQTLLVLKNEIEEGCFSIPQHPTYSKEDIEKKIIQQNKPFSFEIE